MQRTIGNQGVQHLVGKAKATEATGLRTALQRSPVTVQRSREEEGAPGSRPNLDIADTGPGVELLQRRLTQLGAQTAITGQFDDNTHAAVVTFQEARPELHPATGGVGPGTWQALDANASGQQPAAAPQAAKPSHYRLEMKAWIPHAKVVDPEAPSGATALLGLSPRKLEQRMLASMPFGSQATGYQSYYRGDNHAGYDGGWRVMQVVEFDWDGQRVSNVVLPDMPHFGTSHRDVSMRYFDVRALDSRWIDDTDEDTANRAVTGAATGQQEVSIGIHSPNPLTMAPSPDIDADVSVFVSSDPTFGTEDVTLRWSTDLMPSHAFRIVRNGVEIAEQITNDISAMDATGPTAAAEIAIRLTSKSNGGARTWSFVGDQQVK
jgi:peptidoglycan hydrolase-like protein with peptidoglycan-binding domain